MPLEPLLFPFRRIKCLVLHLDNGFATSVSSSDADAEGRAFEGIIVLSLVARVHPESKSEREKLKVLEGVGGDLSVCAKYSRET